MVTKTAFAPLIGDAASGKTAVVRPDMPLHPAVETDDCEAVRPI